jgi:hypothetical protein
LEKEAIASRARELIKTNSAARGYTRWAGLGNTVHGNYNIFLLRFDENRSVVLR